MRSDFSNTVTLWPARLSCAAAARPAGPEPIDRDLLPRARRRRTRHDPAFVERAIDDRQLDRLDRDRILVDAEHARSFARRGAEQAGELGEVVGLVQPLDRRAPVVAIDQVVPVGNQVAERAALVAERNAAVHAARRLPRQLLGRIGVVDVAIVADALGDRARRRLDARVFDEAGGLAHHATRSLNAGSRDSDRAFASAALTRLKSRGITATNCRCVDRPRIEHALADRAAGQLDVTRDQVANQRDLVRLIEPLEIDHVDVAVERERAVGIEHVGDAAAHAGGEVAAGAAEHDRRGRRSCTRSRDRRRLRRPRGRRCCGPRIARRRCRCTKASPLVAP